MAVESLPAKVPLFESTPNSTLGVNYKPFRKLLRVVFVLDADEDPAEVRKSTTLFAIDPEMATERTYRIHRDRFQIKFNFRDAKQHLGWLPARPAPPRATTSTSTPCRRP